MGAGKTLLMDLFADALASDAAGGDGALHLRRVHFNAFIHECHRRLHAHSLTLVAKIREERAERARAAAATEPAPQSNSAPPPPSPPLPPSTSAAAARPWTIMAEMVRGVSRCVLHVHLVCSHSLDTLTQVRRLVVESAPPESGTDLQAALDSISNDILRMPLASGVPSSSAAEEEGWSSTSSAETERAPSELAGPEHGLQRLVEDPDGRPVSCGVLCFDEVHNRRERNLG